MCTDQVRQGVTLSRVMYFAISLYPQIYVYSVCVVMLRIQHHLVVPLVGQRWLAVILSVLPLMGTHHEDLCQLVRLKIYWAQAFTRK